MGAEPPLSSSANQQGGTPRSSQVPAAIELPPYPYDRLEPLKQIALDAHGSVIDLSVGTPCDPPAESV
ncbi:MAG: hypothetical protein F2809_01510, partial [Actinobacteria bacterium]|nr:hypothetical protein [Actinomycetota bacterium]